ncbi:MAG: class I SAM-dependent RNA methyltransferase [Firmicutes bacterium]|nr:class I SAM-dependent RNA methyltransferase [Bacillota bacterium]
MNQYEFSVPCLFGLEGIAGDELRRLDIPNVRVENGRVLFSGGMRELAKANVCLRTGERVLLILADFPAKTFEELFQGVYRTNLEDFIPRDGSFPVKGHCLNSQLMSVPDCQAIVKKAVSKRLGETYGVSWLPETGAKYQLQFSIMNDRVQLYLDTTGPGLHKRGYRAMGNDAPLRETLAAAMVQLTHYRGREFLWDPFCGSGTIPIEAALIARNIAPGARRRFAAEAFAWSDGQIWQDVRTEAKDREFHGSYQILGSDNDPKCVSLSMANARKAGVGDVIRFADGDATKMDLPAQSGILICNPPYGQRMLEQQSAQRLYGALGRHLKYADGWKKFIITSEPEFEHYFGCRATKKRKLYNGMIKCEYYMYTDNSRKKPPVKKG